jgi:hypothetical protein
VKKTAYLALSFDELELLSRFVEYRTTKLNSKENPELTKKKSSVTPGKFNQRSKTGFY